MLLYVAKLSEYAHDVAGQGKQHVGLPGSSSMGAQNLPSTTMICQYERCAWGWAIDVHPPSFGNIATSRKGAMQLPWKGDTVALAMMCIKNADR